MVTETVICNAGPLMALAKLNLLHLLAQLYQRVYFSEAVYAEVVVEGIRRGYDDAHTLRLFLQQMKWQATRVDVPDNLASLALDRGEIESIALALARRGMLLIDEERGRQEARRLGLPVRGTLGIIIAAHDHRVITAAQVRFYFAQIVRRNDIWISPALCRRVLDELEEGVNE